MKKRIKALIGLAVLIGFGLISLIPTFNLKTSTMLELPNDHFEIYYEKQDENAATDIGNRLQKGYDIISKSIKLNPQYKTEVYVYSNLKEFHTKKYGLIGLLIAPDWYIGDNIENKVIIVSPNSPGKQHTYESIASAASHEYVHTLMWNINPGLSKLLNEGMAGYVSGNTKPDYKFDSLPEYNDTHITNPITFGNRGMYQISYTYIEFLDKTYGMDRVMQLIQNNDYSGTFGKSEKEVYDDWIKYFYMNYYNSDSTISHSILGQ